MPFIPADYSKLTIVRATPDQVLQTIKNQYPTWGAPRKYTLEGFIERDDALNRGGNAWEKDDGFVVWALVPQDDPEMVDVLASCETYRRESALVRPGEAKPEKVFSYGIASVYSPAKNRGKGYATHLLRLLHYVLAPESSLPPFPAAWGSQPRIAGFNNAAFSILYSGVGPTFYSKCRQGDGEGSKDGYVWTGELHRAWTVPESENGSRELPAGAKFLTSAEAKALGPPTGRYLFNELANVGDKSKTRIAVLPTENNDLFGMVTLRIALAATPRDHKFGATFPARHTVTASDPAPYVVWTFSSPSAPSPTNGIEEEVEDTGPAISRLLITHAHRPEDIPFDGVLAAARAEGAQEVELWGSFAGWDGLAGGVRRIGADAHDSLPALASYLGDAPLDWVWNEKYAWC